MSLGLEVYSGKVALARLAKDFFSHIAVGCGTQDVFLDDDNPPVEDFLRDGLYREIARKICYRKSFVKEDSNGLYEIGGTLYSESAEETNIVIFFTKFSGQEVNFDSNDSWNTQVREVALFGDVQYVDGVQENSIALNGVYDSETNPGGQVLNSGYMHQVKHIPAYRKVSSDAWDIMFKIEF